MYINKYDYYLTYLTINCSFLRDIGLFHGRMGITLFFSYYSRVTYNKLYEELAGYLLDDIYEELNRDLPICLESGLCGIGWGIEYLVQQGFMEGYTDEILADIDRKVMEIDPLRLSDLSFRHGLAGIAFYVIARLNANRTTSTLPFDDAYLHALQKALNRIEFIDNEAPDDLNAIFNRLLNGEKTILDIPNSLLTTSENSLNSPLENMLLGLQNGIAGLLWNKLEKYNFPNPHKINLYSTKKKYVVLIDEESRSSIYGIGTYIKQLMSILQPTEFGVVHVILASNKTNAISIEEHNDNAQINVAKFENRGYIGNDIVSMKNIYYRNALFALHPYLKNDEKVIFHLNTMQLETFASLIKYYFNKSLIILTVHYTNWSFDLLGNREKLQVILASPKDEKEQAVAKGFEIEKRLMHLCDRIIAIARHSYEDIVSLYQVPQEKVTLIPHGLTDAYQPLSDKERNERRKKYGFSSDDQLLIFAGRIDPVKGVEYLTQAFSSLAEQYPKLRLVIAGDGDFQMVFTALNPVWSKVTCTGFVDKSTLYELFSISDIGILPSLHEEFGFVALEMMMMKLPLIVGNTTGLFELVANNQCGISVNWIQENKEYYVQSLVKAISLLIEDRVMHESYAKRARAIFLDKYSLSLFQQRMFNLYK